MRTKQHTVKYINKIFKNFLIFIRQYTNPPNYYLRLKIEKFLLKAIRTYK